MKNAFLPAATCLAACCLAPIASARPVSSDEAIVAAFTQIQAEHLRAYAAAPPGVAAQAASASYYIREVRTLASPSGTALAYVLTLHPQGYVVTSTDTDIEPVIAYSFDSDFPFGKADHPLWHLTEGDMQVRVDSLPVLPPGVRASNNALWSDYLRAEPGLLAGMAGAHTWGPWVKTKWGQGNPTFWSHEINHYCPCNNDVILFCMSRSVVGCVATAMAQVINYWEYPSSVYLNPATESYTTRSGINISGDRNKRDFPAFADLNNVLQHLDYPLSDWSKRAAVAFACGITVHMNYTGDWWSWDVSSGAYMSEIPGALINKFHYVNAEDLYSYVILRQNMLNAQPALLGIGKAGSAGAHAIVADGYRDDGKYHLNYGWEGDSDGWYSLPAGMPAGYNVVNEMILNIEPNFAPVAAAKLASTYECSGARTPVVLDGSPSSDRNSKQSLAYRWQVDSVLVSGNRVATVQLGYGRHVVNLTVTDAMGASSGGEYVVNVVDTKPPQITLRGPERVIHQCFTAFEDPGATAEDACAGPVEVNVDSTFEPDRPGIYTITYSAIDTHGNLNSLTRTVYVVDNTPRGIKEQVLEELVGLRTQTPAGSPAYDRLSKAIGSLTAALAPGLWLDRTHLAPDRKNPVFQHEKNAAVQLRQLLTLPEAAIPHATVQAAIDRLVECDRLLAVIAIEDATGNIPRLARQQIARGDKCAGGGNCVAAIEHYRVAHQQAQAAFGRNRLFQRNLRSGGD